MTTKILYDLGATALGIGLWFTPSDFTKAVGYSLSIVFSGNAYLTGITLLNKERKNDEVEGIQYEASIDFYERLLENHIDSALEVASTKIEASTLEKLIPLLAHKSNLEKQVQTFPMHPEVSEEDKEKAAKAAIDDALAPDDAHTDESVFRDIFPENLDASSWKAILKALASGSSRDEIIKDVLGCSTEQTKIGRAYFDFLKGKFLE